MTRKLTMGFVALALIVPVEAARAAQSILLNGSVENGPGPIAEDPMNPANWTIEGNVVERSAEANLIPGGEGHALKAFQSNPTELAYQEVPIGPNVAANSVTISASLYTRLNDKVGGDAIAGLALSFYNGSGFQVGSTQTTFPLTAASPANTWIPATITGPTSALTNVAKVRMTCIWVSSTGSGAAFWDNAQLSISSGPNQIINGDFETAGVGEQSPTGIDDWSGFNDQEKSSDFAFHGTSSVRVGMDDPFSGLFQTRDDYPVQDGDRLLLRARVWHSSSEPLTANARAGIKLEFSATSGGGLPPPYENLAFDADSPTDAWTFVDLGTTGLTVPANANKARIVLIFTPNAGSNGEVYFDAASASVNAGPNLLLNPSFESGAVRPDNWSFFETAGESYAVKSAFEVPGYPDVFGGSSAKAGGDNFAGFFQEVNVTPGQTLNVNVQMYMRLDTLLQGTSRAGIKIEWAGGSVPPPVDITTDPSANTITAASPTDTWIPLEIDFTMPPGTEAYPRFVTLTAAGAGAGAAYFDACELVVVNAFDGADADGDGDEDLADYYQFQRCFNGDGADDLGFNCSVFDDDEDFDVDLIDFEYFLPRLTGP